METQALTSRSGNSRKWQLIVGLLLLSVAVTVVLPYSWNVESRPSILAGSQPSPEEVCRKFLDALREEDAVAIRSLAISSEEFAEFIWPRLPASNPKTNLTVEFVWNQMHMHSLADLGETFSRHKGKDYELVDIRFDKETEDYGSYKVHRDTRLLIADSEGRRKELSLFGSLLEMNDEFKIFSFVR
jgi:hypothetical protein